MPTIAAWIKIDGEHAVRDLQQACEKLDGAEGELVLDFSSVVRMDPGAINALDDLAVAAGQKGVKVVLHAVNVDVYKVLKLVKLTSRLSFRGQ